MEKKTPQEGIQHAQSGINKPLTFFRQTYPSINIYYNNQKIQNNNILKQKDGFFYQGTPHHLTIISQEVEYQGEVTQFQPYVYHGKGRFIFKKDGVMDYVYQGEFKNGLYHGFGQLRNSKNIHYIGDFKDDYKSGKGVEIVMVPKEKGKKKGKKEPVFVRESMYDGEFRQGQRQGKGTEDTKFGTYEGEWKNGIKSGNGVMSYKNGDKYKGEWQDNQFNGNGVFIEYQNCKYQGQFKNGKYHGLGKLSFENGDSYQGGFSYGNKHGYGVYTWKDGDYYDGEWKNDFAQGSGTQMRGTEFYDGSFSKGKRDGQGELTNQQGMVKTSKWSYGHEKQQ